jgi:hypothetical protein
MEEMLMSDEIARLREALESIVQWSEAYPLDIFHEPTKDEWKKAHELLTANGMTMDAFASSCMRHVIKGVEKIARDALKEGEA